MADGRDCSLTLIPSGPSCRTSKSFGHRTSAGCCRERRFFSSPIKKRPFGRLIVMADGRGLFADAHPFGTVLSDVVSFGHRTSAGCRRERRFFSSPIKKRPSGRLIVMADGRGLFADAHPFGTVLPDVMSFGHRTSGGCRRERRFFSSPIKKTPVRALNCYGGWERIRTSVRL